MKYVHICGVMPVLDERGTLDGDGDAYGDPSTQTLFCDALVEDGWILDCTDLNDLIPCENNIYDECFVCDPCGDGTDTCQLWNADCNQPVAYDGNYTIEEDTFVSIQLEALDPNGDLKRAMGVSTVPHTFLLNRKKEIIWQHKGYVDGDEMELLKEIKQLVN